MGGRCAKHLGGPFTVARRRMKMKFLCLVRCMQRRDKIITTSKEAMCRGTMDNKGRFRGNVRIVVRGARSSSHGGTVIPGDFTLREAADRSHFMCQELK